MESNSSSKWKQVKIYLTVDQYGKLKSLAEQQGLTVPSLVKSVVLEFLGESEDGDIVSRLRFLEARYEQLASEVGRIEKDLVLLKRRCLRR